MPFSATQGQITFKVFLNANETLELAVTSLDGVEQLSQLFSFHLIVSLSASMEEKMDAITGKSTLLELEGPFSSRLFHGIITSYQCIERGEKAVSYKVLIRPKAFRLCLGKNCRSFQGQTTEQIVSMLLDEGGIDYVFKSNPNKQYIKYELRVQYQESDWAFIERCLAQEGYSYSFSHKMDKHVLEICDDPKQHHTISGVNTLPFVRPGFDVTTEEHITWLDITDAMSVKNATLRDQDIEKPYLKLESGVGDGSSLVGKKDGQRKDLERFDYPAGFIDPKLGKNLATMRLEEEQAKKQVGKGESTSMRLSAGLTFQVSGYPRKSLDQTPLLLTQVRHRATQKTYEDGSITYRCTFACIPKKASFRPATVGEMPCIVGPQTAMVVGTSNEEIYTNRLGQVKVLFPWDRRDKADETASCWVPVSQIWAGSDWGFQFTPRIGQQVVVQFIDGNPDKPLITGQILHGRNLPPLELPKSKTASTIKTRSSPGGKGYNELRFEDKAGEEELYVRAQKDHRIEVLNDRQKTIGRDYQSHIKRDFSETIDRDVEQTIHGNRTISLSDDDGVHQETIMGKVVTRIKRSFHQTITDLMEITTGRKSEVVFGISYEQAASKTIKVKKKNFKLQVIEGAAELTINKEFTLTCGQTSLTLKNSGEIVLSGKQKISINCESNKIVLDAKGITVNGTQITTKAAGKMSIRGNPTSLN